VASVAVVGAVGVAGIAGPALRMASAANAEAVAVAVDVAGAVADRVGLKATLLRHTHRRRSI